MQNSICCTSFTVKVHMNHSLIVCEWYIKSLLRQVDRLLWIYRMEGLIYSFSRDTNATACPYTHPPYIYDDVISLIRHTLEKVSDPPDFPRVYCTFRNNVLYACWQSYNLQRKPAQMRFLSVCLNTYTLLKDVQRPIEGDFTHVWIERQVLETGKNHVREEILHGECDFKYRILTWRPHFYPFLGK